MINLFVIAIVVLIVDADIAVLVRKIRADIVDNFLEPFHLSFWIE
jgi:hypothetical protein